MYLTPIIKDYLKEKYPERLVIRFRMYYPEKKEILLHAHVDNEL